MEQNSQNGAFYPHSVDLRHHAFYSAHERFSQGPSPFLPPGYAPPSAPSFIPQNFHTMDSVQGLDYAKLHEEKDTCNIPTVAASDSTTKTNAENFPRALEDLSKRLSQLESIVQGLECSIEGLRCAEKEKHDENNDKLARLELLIKEVLTGVQHLNESQKLDGAISKMRKLQVSDEKASVYKKVSLPEQWRHLCEPHSNLEPSEISEQSTERVTIRPSPQAPAPPPSQNHLAPHIVIPQLPSMSEPGKLAAQHPYPPPLLPPVVLPSNGQALSSHHSMQVPPFPDQTQGLVPSSLATPPPQGLPNVSGEATSYGHTQGHQQYSEPPSPLINGYHKFREYHGGVHQEVPHSSPQYGFSGPRGWESAARMAGYTPVFGSPFVQSQPQSSSSVPIYETVTNNGPSHGAAQLVPSTTVGRGSHSLPLHSALPASNGMPVGSPLPSHNQISEVTEKMVAMGFPREQVRAAVQELTDIERPVDMRTVLDKLMIKRVASPHLQRGGYNL